MSNVKEYLKLQRPYLIRIQKNIRRILRLWDETGDPETIKDLKAHIEIYMEITSDASGLIKTHVDLINGYQEQEQMLSYSAIDIEAFPEGSNYKNLTEHEAHTIDFCVN